MQQVINAVKAEIRREKAKAIISYAIATRQQVTYIPLAAALGMFSGGRELAELLGEIMTEDYEAGRPLSPSVVVGNQTGVPGKGYYEMAKSLGYAVQPGQEKAFWKNQMSALGYP